MDPVAATNSLIDAIKASQASQLSVAGINKDNAFSTINNSANRRGSLYSTAPATQKTKYVGTAFDPTVQSIATDSVGKQVAAYQNLTSVQSQIDAQNRAANILNNIKFDQYGASA